MLSAYRADALSLDETDGVSLTFEDWRFNLRRSNTEPLVRLNIESRGGGSLAARVTNIADLLGGEGLRGHCRLMLYKRALFRQCITF